MDIGHYLKPLLSTLKRVYLSRNTAVIEGTRVQRVSTPIIELAFTTLGRNVSQSLTVFYQAEVKKAASVLSTVWKGHREKFIYCSL